MSQSGGQPEQMDALSEGSDEVDDEPLHYIQSEVEARDIQWSANGQAFVGVDIQGINWNDFNVSRAGFRLSRLMNYPNYENLNEPRDGIEREKSALKSVYCEDFWNGTNGSMNTNNGKNARQQAREFFKFRYSKSREPRFSIVHFQLRNLLWATSKHDLFYPCHGVVRHWSPLTRSSRPVLDLEERGLGGIKISTMCAKDGVLMVGGFGGEYVCMPLDLDDSNDDGGIDIEEEDDVHGRDLDSVSQSQTPIHKRRRTASSQSTQSESQESTLQTGALTHDMNSITNHLDITTLRSGSQTALASSNDNHFRLLDLNTFTPTLSKEFNYPVNCSSMSPEKNMLALVGDTKETTILSLNGDVVATLSGHIDYSFAVAWSPAGNYLATGNQDKTTRLYDIRMMDRTLGVIGSQLGAVRSLRFTSDGRFLAIAEPADFVHIIDLFSMSVSCEDGLNANDVLALRQQPLFSSLNHPKMESAWSSSSSLSLSTPIPYQQPNQPAQSFTSTTSSSQSLSSDSVSSSNNKPLSSRTSFVTQSIDFFGEIPGITFANDDNSLFIGNADESYGGIMEFERCRVGGVEHFIW